MTTLDITLGTAVAVGLGLLIWWVTESLQDHLDALEIRRGAVEIATAYRLHGGFSDCDLLTASAVSIDDSLTTLSTADIHYPVRNDLSNWMIEFERPSTRGGLRARFSRMDGTAIVEQFVHEFKVAGLPHGQTFVTAAFGRSC